MLRDPQRKLVHGPSTQLERAGQRHASPGKRTLTEAIAASEGVGIEAEPAQPPAAPAQLRERGAAAPRPTLAMLFGIPPAGDARPPATPPSPAVQHRSLGAAAGQRDSAAIHAAAQRGIASSATQLPYADAIQRSFGRHDISSVQAHVDDDAASAAVEMGTDAYATGSHVVLGPRADLFVVAHEAAHVVQQRGSIQLLDGVGAAGDRYEQHANDVAALVVQGKSAEHLLDEHAPRDPGAPRPAPCPAATAPIQRFPVLDAEGKELGIDTDDEQFALKIVPFSTPQLIEIARFVGERLKAAPNDRAQRAWRAVGAAIGARKRGDPDGVDPMTGLAANRDLILDIVDYLSDEQLRAMMETNHAWRSLGIELLASRLVRAMRDRHLGEVEHVLSLARFPVETITDEYGNTPLHLAILYGHQPLIERLLATGHPVDVLNHDGLSPSMMLEDNAQGTDERERPFGLEDEGQQKEAEEMHEEDGGAGERNPRGGRNEDHGHEDRRRAPRKGGNGRNRKTGKREREKESERRTEDHDSGAADGATGERDGRPRLATLDLGQLRVALETEYNGEYVPGGMVEFHGRSVPYLVSELLTATHIYNSIARASMPIPLMLEHLRGISELCRALCLHRDSVLEHMTDGDKVMNAKALLFHWRTQLIPALCGKLAMAVRAHLAHLGPPPSRRFPERHYSVDPTSAPAPRGGRGWKNVPEELKRDPDLETLARHKGHEPNLKSTQEALSGLAAKRLRGRFTTITPAPRRAGEDKDVEFYDAYGMPWDQKGPCSHTGEDGIAPIVNSISLQLDERFPAKGKDQRKEDQPQVGVILDCTYLTERDYRRLWAMLIARFDAAALERIVEVNVDYSGLRGQREGGSNDVPSNPPLEALLAKTESPGGRGSCGGICTISETKLRDLVTNLADVRNDRDGQRGFAVFENHDGHLPQVATSYFVEYAVEGKLSQGASGNRVKLVHDKRGEGRLFITATHYTPWVQRGPTAALRNPFFEVVRK